MLSRKTRRLFALALAVALIFGRVGYPSPASADAAIPAAVMSMDMSAAIPMHGKCDGCAGDEKATASAACSAYCGTIAAFALIPIAYSPSPAETLGPRLALAATGLSVPPDPYPPRPTDMN